MTTVPHRITVDRPSWLIGNVLAGGGELVVRFRFSAAERKVYRKRKAVPVSEWCERHRVVTMSSLPGRWQNSVTSYLAGIMDASFHQAVRDITICKAPQTGGSEAINNCIAYAADRAPGPCLYVYPDELTAKENCQDRITPMFTSSPRLRSLMSGRDDDASALKLKLVAMPVYMAWSSSVPRLANKPIKYGVWDETDKCKRSNKEETDTGHLIPIRLTTFRWTSKFWKISSPTVEGGYIWQAMLAAQVIFEFVSVCPDCGGHQVMHFGDKESAGGVKFPDDQRDPDSIELNELAWYQCEHCASHWSDYRRDQAVRAGYWRAKNDGRRLFDYLDAERPRKIGFHLPAWLSTFVSLSKVAASFLRCKPAGKTLDFNAYKNFHNTFMAEPWLQIIGKERRIEEVMALKDDDAMEGVVPSWALCLLLTCDVQKYGIWYELRAWGEHRTSRLIRHGFLAGGLAPDIGSESDFAALKMIANASYWTADKLEYRVRFGLADSGYRTDEVYEFCRANPVFAPSKGHAAKVTPVSYTKIDTFPGTGRLIQGGVVLVNVDTTIFKDRLSMVMQTNKSDPGAWVLHNNIDDGYCMQYTAEIKDEETGLWKQRGNQANHLWDCGVLQLVALEILEKRGEMARLTAARQRTQQQKQQQRKQPQGHAEKGRIPLW